ncbi:MAG: efflux transporter periplasmic adaptor subunit [Anaerosolibacter sp.]|uniref:efflux RND transporter periplasmic adaptor subunit n=1 Tax=Anaerosolibacter sp. TaxID=1872527 RepID=UPI0026310384|nr:efflux RND transporter periplasmic adaptor subunit [Anaerosolibacter sp.]MDF2545288.1 efflux transporter periplasmic adaptor subunit [Anaerosolibacter sp.]
MKKKIKWIALAVIVIVGIVFFAVGRNQAVEVETFKVETGTLEKYIEEVGTVKMEQQTTIYALETGKVVELFVNVGDLVKAGDVLAKLDEKEMAIQLAGLQAEKEAAAAQYQEALKPSDGEAIKKAQLAVKTAEINFEEAKRTADNSKKLYEAGAISYESYKGDSAKLELEEAALESAKSDLEIAKKGISAQQKKEFEARISQVQAQIDLLDQRKMNFIIKAPQDGMIMSKEIQTGTYIQTGMPVFEIGNSTDVYIESDVLVSEIGDVKEGGSVVIWNEDLNIEEVKGTVKKIHPKAFSKVSDLGIEQKRVKVEINLPQTKLKLRPDYDMDIRIVTLTKPNVLWIPENAVFEYQGADHVFINNNGAASLRKIEKGIDSEDRVEVVDGLKEGEQVILSPDETLTEGAKIKKKELTEKAQ